MWRGLCFSRRGVDEAYLLRFVLRRMGDIMPTLSTLAARACFMRFDCHYLPVFLAFLHLRSGGSLLVLSLTLLFGKTVKSAYTLKSILISFKCPFFFRVVLERFD